MISLVIPLLNERANLADLHAEIVEVAASAGLDCEILYVDDGSTDGSWDLIRELGQNDSRVRGIRFRTNFGKAAALMAGFQAVRGSCVLTLDADGQDDPHEIPHFLARLDQFDVVSGWKQIRHDPWHKVFPSRVFNWMVSSLTGVHLHDHNCGMKCYRSEVLREVRIYGELHRFIPVLAQARGFRVGELVIHHRPRTHGRSKYGVSRFLKGFLDLLTVKFLTGYITRPQHALGSIGLGSFLLGMLTLIYLAITWVIRLSHPEAFPPLHERPLLFYALGALLVGAQFLALGFLAELMTALHARDEDRYSVAERLNDFPEPTP